MSQNNKLCVAIFSLSLYRVVAGTCTVTIGVQRQSAWSSLTPQNKRKTSQTNKVTVWKFQPNWRLEIFFTSFGWCTMLKEYSHANLSHTVQLKRLGRLGMRLYQLGTCMIVLVIVFTTQLMQCNT